MKIPIVHIPTEISNQDYVDYIYKMKTQYLIGDLKYKHDFRLSPPPNTKTTWGVFADHVNYNPYSLDSCIIVSNSYDEGVTGNINNAFPTFHNLYEPFIGDKYILDTYNRLPSRSGETPSISTSDALNAIHNSENYLIYDDDITWYKYYDLKHSAFLYDFGNLNSFARYDNTTIRNLAYKSISSNDTYSLQPYNFQQYIVNGLKNQTSIALNNDKLLTAIDTSGIEFISTTQSFIIAIRFKLTSLGDCMVFQLDNLNLEYDKINNNFVLYYNNDLINKLYLNNTHNNDWITLVFGRDESNKLFMYDGINSIISSTNSNFNLPNAMGRFGSRSSDGMINYGCIQCWKNVTVDYTTTYIEFNNLVSNRWYDNEDEQSYGVYWDETQPTATYTRIGNMDYHKYLPIQNKMRGCTLLYNPTHNRKVNYYLDTYSDFLKEDGKNPSILDGSDGEVMTEIPDLYYKCYRDGVLHYNKISLYPLPGYKFCPKKYIGRYEATTNRIDGSTHSVINTTNNFRGGGNQSSYDNTFRDMRGCPSSDLNRKYYRDGARLNRNNTWNIKTYFEQFLILMLFRVEYATANSQLDFTSALTTEGYKQGGLGLGVTDIYDKYPFIPCGYSGTIGNRTGYVNFVRSFEHDAFAYNTNYRGIWNNTTQYNVNEWLSNKNDTIKGLGDGKLYKCILQPPIGTLLTNTTYFTQQTRSITQVNRYRGIELPFGHLKEHIDGLLIKMDATLTYDEDEEMDVSTPTSKAYIFTNYDDFAETETGNETFFCNLPIDGGYIKLFNIETFLPQSTDGGSDSWGCDFHYAEFPYEIIYEPWLGGSLRGCLGGGGSGNSLLGGLACSDINFPPSYAVADFSARLCSY